jgi:hypothetical protein
LIETNPHRYSTSPYRVRKLKAKPKLIYPKDATDRLFLYSEGGRNVDTYNCSHVFKYGNSIEQKTLENELAANSQVNQSGLPENNEYIRRERA